MGDVLVPAAPVALLDLLDFFLVQPEIVADFMNERLAIATTEIVLILDTRSSGPWNNRIRSGKVFPWSQRRSVNGVP